jgi:hypothetical protein
MMKGCATSSATSKTNIHYQDKRRSHHEDNSDGKFEISKKCSFAEKPPKHSLGIKKFQLLTAICHWPYNI